MEMTKTDNELVNNEGNDPFVVIDGEYASR